MLILEWDNDFGYDLNHVLTFVGLLNFYPSQLMSRRKNNPVVLCVDDDVAVLQAIRSLLEKTMSGQDNI